MSKNKNIITHIIRIIITVTDFKLTLEFNFNKFHYQAIFVKRINDKF